jgi:signal transduction histidine kinase
MSVRDTHRTQTHLIRACDVVFGSTSIILAVLATLQEVMGATGLGLVLALWAVPAANIAWSFITKNRDRAHADLIRGIVCVPLATYIYVAEPAGVWHQLWLPGLMLSVSVSLSVGIGTRRVAPGVCVAAAYALGIVVVGGLDRASVGDALGILVTDTILSIVAAHLGHTLYDATHQRDEAREQRARAEATLAQLAERSDALSRALAELHAEMARRMRLEAELLQAQKLESVGRLATGIAHEINTPVQFVGDSIQFVGDAMTELLPLAKQVHPDGDVDLDYLVDEVPRALKRAMEGVDRVATIVRSMKMFAHPDATEMAHTELNRAIEATLTVARNEYKYVADLVTDFAPDLPPVRCFISELNQAVLNIVVNAAHAIADTVAGTDRRGTIEVRTRRDGDDVVVAVRDTGGGIPEAIRSRVFDPFFTTKEVGRGTGQGLAIAHAVVVDKHHGKLWFESEIGVGTTFFIRIPVDGSAQARVAA